MARAGTVEVLLTGDMAGLEKALQRAEKAMEGTASRLRSVAGTLAIGVTAPLAALGGVALNSSIGFEQAMAGVAKTVDAPEEAIARLGQGFTELSEVIPVARTELAGIAEEAGQLGVAFDKIPQFTRVVADLRVATNLGQEAGTTLARLANIMGDVDPAFDRMGATIVDLGNNSASTEREIADMALRIAGAGKVIGLYHPEVMAFAAGLSSVGIESEAGGTAISRVMVEIANAVRSGGEKLGKFAQVAGMSSAEFKEAFEQDAAGAVISFIEGLGRLDAAGVNVFAVLEDVEFQNVRIRDALLRATGAGDLLRRSLDLGRDAWQENTALTAEAERFYQTTGNQLVILRNRVNNIAGELGDVLVPALIKVVDAAEPVIQIVRTLVQVFADLSEPVQMIIIATGALLAMLAPLAFGLSTVVSTVGVLAGTAGAAGASVGFFSMSLATLGALLTPGGVLLAGLALLAALWVRNKIEAAEAARVAEEATQKYLASMSKLDKEQTFNRLGAAKRALAKAEQELADLRAKAEEERSRVRPGGYLTGGITGIVSDETNARIKAQEEHIGRLKAGISQLEKQYIDLAKAEQVAANVVPPPTPGSFDFGASEQAKQIVEIHQDLAMALQTAAGMERLLGDAFDENRAKASAYRSAIQALLEEGVDPASPKLQEYAAALLEAEAATKAADDAEKAAQEAKRERDRLEADALAIVQQAMTAQERYTQQVKRLDSALAEGLITQEQYNKAVGYLDDELAKSTKSMAQTLKEQGVAAGEALIRGLLTGSRNMGDLMKNAVINLAIAKIMGPLKLALGIRSPSRVFMGYGEMIGQGLAIGIESSADRVARATDHLFGAVTPPSLAPAFSLAAPSAAAVSMAGAGRIDLDPSRLPRPLTPFEAARDHQWQALIRESVNVSRSQGWR